MTTTLDVLSSTPQTASAIARTLGVDPTTQWEVLKIMKREGTARQVQVLVNKLPRPMWVKP